MFLFPRAPAALLTALFAAGLAAPMTTMASEKPIELRLGEKRALEVGPVARVAIEKPSVLDARPLTAESLGLEALGVGSTALSVVRKDGSRTVYRVVVGPPAPPEAASAKPQPLVLEPERIEHANCGEPKLEAAADALKQAEGLQKQGKHEEAIKLLLEARRLEPTAAIVLARLGSSYARLARIDEGAQAYATFLESCPKHSYAPAVRAILAEYTKQRQP